MKLYGTSTAPNDRRVRIFAREKGISLEFVELDLEKGDNLTASYRAKNPLAKIPLLELDDGEIISESVAICRYFEEIAPEPPLMGTTALEKARIEMWQRRVEFAFLMQVGMGFQHITGYFRDRMTPFPEWGQECRKQAADFMTLLEKHLAESPYIAGESFSIADITALCTIDFARVIKLRVAEDQTNLQRWYKQVSQRPGVKNPA